MYAPASTCSHLLSPLSIQICCEPIRSARGFQRDNGLVLKYTIFCNLPSLIFLICLFQMAVVDMQSLKMLPNLLKCIQVL